MNKYLTRYGNFSSKTVLLTSQIDVPTMLAPLTNSQFQNVQFLYINQKTSCDNPLASL